jgi:pimeloyl-ACP methyl ester carboxylesterase
MEYNATSSDGARIALTEIGAGSNRLVIAPGGLAAAPDWRPVAQALESRCRSIVINRRGRGSSDDPPEHNLALERDDVLATLTLAGPDAALIGHSYSAVCALEAALVHPVRRLILYEPPLHASINPISEQLQALLDSDRPDEMVRFFLINAVQLPQQAVDAMRESPAWAGLVSMAHTLPREVRALEKAVDSIGHYAAVECPTLLIVGEHSSAGLKESTSRLASLLPNATTTVLRGQGHVAHRTAPRALAEAVVAFL